LKVAPNLQPETFAAGEKRKNAPAEDVEDCKNSEAQTEADEYLRQSTVDS